ncbi:PREDICTED: uncharacterized protein C12orf55 homolog [Elephantulus edwardii]|uniref:uncharacterized protein C12orf55 homolog n=1 Tax=Elephantulus edwardii TaxID=28737 RepID=UPI0003F0855A|nr:PREDICTED: uncharacterized protein C12orf55 homolog [Elephantulus edwardii]
MAAQRASSVHIANVSPTSPLPSVPPSTPMSTLTRVSKSPRQSKTSSGVEVLSNSPRLPPSACSQDTLPLAVFYGPLDAKNPLLASFEKEIRELLGFMKRKATIAITEEKLHEFQRRCTTSLFNIWTKYAPRLPVAYYNQKLLKVGDSLCEMKFHALNNKNICCYQLVCDNDANLQNKESVVQCLQILSSLRLIMQVALPQEHLSWIVYNGTIYIYTVCRKLMASGQSSKVLEYLLWASMCMESSVPLLSVRYLTWRATLYTAVCQCYYDCKSGVHGEAFARRALGKIDELRQLELMSSTQQQEDSRRYYREATIKMAVMVFKRGVFESRRKNKTIFRPKQRVNLKEVQTLPWPRTLTERLLDEMFDSNAARFLAVLEALSDSHRRTLQTGPFATEEVELRDVVAELFVAGKELLIALNTDTHGMLGFSQTSLMECIIERKNNISLDAAVRFIKLAFNYEEWSLFESAASQFLCYLQKQDHPEAKQAEMDLTLLLAIEPLINVKKSKGLVFPLESFKEGDCIQAFTRKVPIHSVCMKTLGYSEDIFQLAATLYSCLCNSSQNVQPDKEIVVDMIMFLWQRCKLGIQRLNMSKNESSKLTQKINTNKWVYLLWLINEIIHCCKMEDIDIVVVAEITLRLCEILEYLGNHRRKQKKYPELGFGE